MESWQKDYINEHLPQLIESTVCNSALLIDLLGKNLISGEEYENLNYERDNKGGHYASRSLYQLLQTRVDSYNGLRTSLRKCRQTEALKILSRALSNDQTVPSVSQPAETNELDYIADYRTHYFEKKMTVRMKYSNSQSKRLKDEYHLPRYAKGIAFVASVCEFDYVQERDGAHIDAELMAEVFQELGFTIFEDCVGSRKRWNKEELISSIDKMKTVCDTEVEDHRPKCIVVFISSHGAKDYIAATDSKKDEHETTWINLDKDILFKFQRFSNEMRSGSEYLGKVPKIFLFNACQQLTRQKDSMNESTAPFENAIVAVSQVTGHPSYRHAEYGSYFPHILAYVLMNYAREKSLWGMLKMTARILKDEKMGIGQILSLTDIALENLYLYV